MAPLPGNREPFPAECHDGRVTSYLQVRTYPAAERPEIEVLMDGVWHAGVLREWRQLEDRSWVANVRWSVGRGQSSRLDTVPADRVRPGERLHQWLHLTRYLDTE